MTQLKSVMSLQVISAYDVIHTHVLNVLNVLNVCGYVYVVIQCYLSS